MTGCRVDDLAPNRRPRCCTRAGENVIITLGANGALLSEQGVKTHIPCFPSQPCDTTGAGDAFNGALAARLACGDALHEATGLRRPMPRSASKGAAPHLCPIMKKLWNVLSMPLLMLKWPETLL